MEARKQIFRQFGCCWDCSRKGHRSRECKFKTLCHCGGRHHPSICDAENYGKKVKEKEIKVSGLRVQTKQSGELTEEPTEKEELKEVAVGGLHVKTGGGKALQSLQALVTASGERQSVKCRCLLDSACNKTFVRSELAQMFKAKPKRREMVNISSFGKHQGSIQSEVYDVEIKGYSFS